MVRRLKDDVQQNQVCGGNEEKGKKRERDRELQAPSEVEFPASFQRWIDLEEFTAIKHCNLFLIALTLSFSLSFPRSPVKKAVKRDARDKMCKL